ncbi:MAG TPA: hypothetical protein VFS75_01390 [Candidatus Paceibacterota bacterium]|nr:hypothetical protein [Candidatus Paceibacterota bacterium]
MFEDDDRILYLKTKVRRARKPHRCVECKRVITKGETYHFNYYAYVPHRATRPYFESAKMCDECHVDWEILLKAELRESVFATHKCYGELRNRVLRACEDRWLTEPEEVRLYVRWAWGRTLRLSKQIPLPY